MSEWREYTLGDIVDIKHGYAFKGEFFSETPTTNILVTPGNFKIGGGFKSDKLKYYNGEIPDGYTLSHEDIIVTMTDLSKQADTLGYSAKVPNDPEKNFLHNQRIGLLKFKDKSFDKDFIYWLLRAEHYQKFVAGSATGATVKHSSPSRIRTFKFKAPTSNTLRKKIAKILSNYDDLIENNLKRIKLLEESVRLTYEMKLEGYNSWKEFKLVDISDYLGRGVTPKYKENSGFLAINQKANKGSFLDITNFKEYELGNWVPEEKYAQNGDILINSLGEGTIGRVHFYNWENNKYPVDQHMSIFRAQKNISIYIFHLLSSELGQAILHTIKKGGTNMTMLNINDLRNIKVRLPSQHEFNKTSNAMIEMYDLKSKLEFQNQLLKEARNILLPRLMTGMIDTDDMDVAV